MRRHAGRKATFLSRLLGLRAPPRAKDPDEVFRAFTRVLARLAPRGGAPAAHGAVRQKP